MPGCEVSPAGSKFKSLSVLDFAAQSGDQEWFEGELEKLDGPNPDL